MNVSEYIANYLERKKIKNIFLLTGGGMMYLTDALYKSKINLIFNHNEQASFFATDGLARVSESCQVSFVTSGPGLTNIVTGVLSAWQDSIPIVIIGGQCKSTETIQFSKIKNLRQNGTFEANGTEILKPITKFSAQVNNPNLINYYLDKAFFIANHGRPGPVYLEIPLDIQSSQINKKKIFSKKLLNKKIKKKTIDSISIYKKILKAKKPIILAGYGVRASKSTIIFRKLINKLKVPVVVTQFAKDIISNNSQYFIGHPGPKGNRAANIALQNADLILIVGCSLHSQTIGWEHNLFAPKAYKIQVDIDKSVLKKTYIKVNKKINYDTFSFLKEFEKLNLKIFTNTKWLDECLLLKAKFSPTKEKRIVYKNKFNYYHLADQLSNLIPDNSTIVTDAGSGYYILGQNLKLKTRQRYIVPGSHGQMGYALSAANGASSYNRKKLTICISGDGSIMTNLHDLSVTSKNNFNVKIFVISNGGYASIRNSQIDFFKNNFGTDKFKGLFIPNYKNLAKVFKIQYYTCKNSLELNKIAKKIFKEKGPCIIECHTLFTQDIAPSLKSKMVNGKLKASSLDNMHPYLEI
jgi:acetolactate synthase-1/2/3 large subunit